MIIQGMLRFSDGGSDCQKAMFRAFLRERGVKHEVTPPYTQELSGVAERMSRNLIESARYMLMVPGLDT